MKVLVTLVVLIVLGVLVVIFEPGQNLRSTQSDTNNSTTSVAPTTKGNELIIGQPDAKATIIEYADYKCPSCGAFHQSAGKQLREEYIENGLLKIIFRPFPVYAVDGAQALIGSYCAKDQQKFTEYHDALFEYMWVNHFREGDYQKAIDTVLTAAVMDQIMTNIGMDPPAYKKCMDSKIHEKTYYDTIELAAPDEVQGTPSFIINGRKVVGPQPFSVFKTLVDIQLQ